jgi:hypothetical protein
VRITLDIPEPLHNALRLRAQESGVSVRSLIIRALEQAYDDQRKGSYVTAPLIQGKGKLGRAFPTNENPHDLVF